MDRVMNGMLNNFGELPEDIKKIDTSLDNISNEEMTENLERLHTDRYFKMMDSLDTLSEDAEIMKLEKELHRRSVDEIIARENDNVYEVIWKDSTVVGGKQRFYALDKKEAILRAKHESRYGSDYKVILIGKASEFKLVSNEGKVPDVTKDNQETVIKKLIEGFIFVGRYQDVNSSCKVYANPETREVKEIETFDNGNKTERSYYYTKEEDYTEDYYTEEINNKLRDLFPAEYEGPEESLVKNLLSGSGRLYEEDYTEEPDFDAGEEAVVDEPTEEPVAPTEEEAPEAKKDEAPKLKKEYLGKTEDTHYYIIANETDEGQAEDLQIVDQGGIKKYSAKDNNLDITDVVGFIIKAIEEVEIAQIERGIFMKYILPKLTEEEKPEVEEEPAGTEEEEVKAEEPEEEEEVEESKVIKEDNKDLLDKVDHALNDLEDDMIHILWKKYVEQEQELDINLLKEQLVNVAEADEDVLKEIAKDLGINESKVNEEIKISDIKVKELKNIGLVLSAKTSKGDYSQFYNTQDVTSSTYVDNVEQAKDRFITFYNKFEGKVPDVTKDNQETVIKKLTEKGNKMDKNTKYVLKVDQPDHSTDIIKEFSASMSLDQVKKEINSLLAVEEKWPKEIGEGSVVYLETPEGKALAWEGDENWVDYTGSMGVKNKQENTVERDKAYKEQKALRVKGRELYTKGYLLRGEDGAKLRAEGNKLIDQADEIWEPYVESEEHIGERKIKEDKLNLNIKMLILQGLLRGQNEDEIRRNLKSHRYDEEEYDQLVSNLMLKMKGASKEIIQKELDANEIERLKNPFYDEEVIADVPDEIENKFGSFHNYTEEEASRILKELEKVEKSKNIKMAIRVSNKWCDTIGSDDYSGEAVGPFYAGEGEDKGLWGYEGGMLSEEEVFDNMKTMIEDTKIYISLLNESKLKKLTEKGDKMGTRKISAGILRNFKQKIAKETYNKSYEELDYDEILDLSPEIGQFLDSYQGSSRNKGNFCLSYESQGHNVWSFCFDSKEEANEFLNEYEKNKEDKGIPSLENLKTGEKLVMSDAEWEEDTSVAEDDFRTKKGKSDYNADLLKDNGDFEIKKENYHNKATNADFVRFSIIGKKSGREYCPMALNWGIEELPNQKKRLAAELAALKQQKEKRIKEDKSINILRDLLHLND